MAEFRIDQPGGAGTGTAGVARVDLQPGHVIELHATTPAPGAGISYAWEIIDKVGCNASLSAASGSVVTIGTVGGDITAPAAFRVKMTVDDHGMVSTTERIVAVRSTYAQIRPGLFGEDAPASQRLASFDASKSMDNAVYADRSGLGSPGQNPFGWREWAWELVKAVEQNAYDFAHIPPPAERHLIFDPLGTPSINVFTTPASLVAAIATFEGPVYVDLKADLTLPTASYSWPNIEFHGKQSGGARTGLNLGGATITAGRFFVKSCDVTWTNLTNAPVVLTSAAEGRLDLIDSYAAPTTTTQPLVQVDASSYGYTVLDNTIVSGTFATTAATAVYQVICKSKVLLDDTAFAGSGTLVVYDTSGSAKVPRAPTGFASYTLIRCDYGWQNGRTVVWAPGSTSPSSGIFATFAEAYAALVELGNHTMRRLLVDTSASAGLATIPSAVSAYDFTNLHIELGFYDSLEFDAGARYTSTRIKYTGGWVYLNGPGTVVHTLTAGQDCELELEGAYLYSDPATPLIDVQGFGYLRVTVRKWGEVGAWNALVTAPSIRASGGIVDVLVYEDGQIDSHGIGSTDAGSTLDITWFSAAGGFLRDFSSHPLWTAGTLAFHINTRADRVGYTDTNAPVLGATEVQAAIDATKQRFDVMLEPTGFASTGKPALTFTDGTRTLSLAPSVGLSFDVYAKGRKFTKASDSVAWTNVEGLHIFYYDATGTLLHDDTGISALPTILGSGAATVAIIYWDTTNAASIYRADERHGLTMDNVTHAHLHLSLGTQWITGLALNVTTEQDGSLAAHAQIGATNGVIRDEDLSFSITDGSPQTLAAPAVMPVYYRLGASGNWRRKAATTYPFIESGTPGYAGTLPAYNQYTGGAWQLTELTSNDYFLAHIFATNDVQYPVVAVAGTTRYTSVSSARTGALTEMNNLVVQDLFVEWTPLGSVIYQTNSGYANAAKARARNTSDGSPYVDFRARDALTASPVTVHGNLSGLDADDHPAYALGAGSSTATAIPTFTNTDGRTLKDNASSTIDGSGYLQTPRVGAGVAPLAPLHGATGAAGTAGAVLRLATTTGDISLFVHNATPEGAITGSPGDLCIDGTAGRAYQKASGIGTNTGWQLLGGGGTYRIDAATQYVVASGYTGIDITVGGFIFDPSTESPIKFEVLGNFSGTLTAKLYEVGAPGTGGYVGILRSTLTVTMTNGYGSAVATLSPVASPGTNTNEISLSEKYYEVRINATTTGVLTWAGLKCGNSGS